MHACPNPLPSDLDSELQQLAQFWVAHSLRPRVDPTAAANWDRLIDCWIADTSLPLFVRREERGIARGEVVRHGSGRDLVPTDNSPAGWSFMAAYAQQCPTIDDIKKALSNDTIPVAMVVTAEMQARATYKCSRSCFETPNKLGWKVCHIEPVGLHGRASITERPILELQGHFRRLLSPSNMFLVPLILAGLGEIPHFIKAVRCESHVRTEDTLGANA